VPSKSSPEDSFDVVDLVGDHEEEVSEGGKTVRRRGIFLLPNLVTTAALFAGFYAIVSAMNGRYESAALAIFAAMIFDGLDGRVARLTNTQSKFGAEYDSLSDMVSFGVAPAMVMFTFALSGLGRLGWAAAFVYVACAALRLARFNTQIDTTDKNFFTGLASPAAAAVQAATIWVCEQNGFLGKELPHLVSILLAVQTMLMGFLMISNVRYNSFKDMDFRNPVPFVVMIAVVVGFGVVLQNPPAMLLLGFWGYASSGLITAFLHKFRAKNQ
jgi:CDP-diacylglycerol--serine O-phosphatidyltransferase